MHIFKLHIKRKVRSKIVAGVTALFSFLFLWVLTLELNYIENLDFQIINELQQNLSLISNAQSHFHQAKKQFELYVRTNNYSSIEELKINGQKAENFLQILQKETVYSSHLLPLEEYLSPIRDDLNFFLYKTNIFIDESYNSYFSIDSLEKIRTTFLGKLGLATKSLESKTLKAKNFEYQKLFYDARILQERIYHHTWWLIYVAQSTNQFLPLDTLELSLLDNLKKRFEKVENDALSSYHFIETIETYKQNVLTVYQKHTEQNKMIQEIQIQTEEMQKKFSLIQERIINIFLEVIPESPQIIIHFCFFGAGVFLALGLYWWGIRKKWKNLF